ncbi:MAG: branched chain amino acid aminotransferase [Candidatus Aminicenantes bacterium RBG_16_63_16]|nr:MAG: branched chain amino acid aminotransferase [Candidatus Aminicenantes bacterium RBG_16_63_16]
MSPFDENAKVWMNGRLVPWNQANIHIASHVVHYGSSLFEGFRAYDTPKGTAVFRLEAHTKRLFNSCKMYRMDVPYTMDEFNAAILETIRANGLRSCYVRPIIYRGYRALGVDPFPNPVDCAILVWNWGKYLGEDALDSGVDVCVSSWWRMAPNTFPALAKAGANYMNSQLIKMEAILDGYAEGIALNIRGHISEGSGENIFLAMNGAIYTPPLSSSVLPGITRDSVIILIRELGLKLVEETIPREMLYVADEVFFTGSAAEITPIRSIDKIIIGSGRRGPIVKKLQDAFFAYINGEREDTFRWLTYL